MEEVQYPTTYYRIFSSHYEWPTPRPIGQSLVFTFEPNETMNRWLELIELKSNSTASVTIQVESRNRELWNYDYRTD